MTKKEVYPPSVRTKDELLARRKKNTGSVPTRTCPDNGFSDIYQIGHFGWVSATELRAIIMTVDHSARLTAKSPGNVQFFRLLT